MTMLSGFAGGLVFYCATAFPFAALAHIHGGAWAAMFMLYGVVCGAVGTMLAATR